MSSALSYVSVRVAPLTAARLTKGVPGADTARLYREAVLPLPVRSVTVAAARSTLTSPRKPTVGVMVAR